MEEPEGKESEGKSKNKEEEEGSVKGRKKGQRYELLRVRTFNHSNFI